MPTGPSAPAGAISGPTVKAGSDGDKWNPYSDEGRIRQALFGNDPGWQDPLEPYKPALGSIGVSFIPGLNSYMVLKDPEASTASKVLAVGSDVLAVVGAKGVLIAVKAGSKVLRGGLVGAEAAQGAEKALIEGGTYLLRDLKTGKVMRTGRTVNFLRRAGEHGRDPVLKIFEFEPIHHTGSYAEQRGLEQYLHNLYGPPLNKINPISPWNPKGPSYMKAAQIFLESQ
jgi:hypothetical protein